MKTDALIHYLASSILFSLVGIAILLLAFWVIEKITPENLWRAILHEKNVALAIMGAAFIIAIAIIIASAIHG